MTEATGGGRRGNPSHPGRPSSLLTADLWPPLATLCGADQVEAVCSGGARMLFSDVILGLFVVYSQGRCIRASGNMVPHQQTGRLKRGAGRPAQRQRKRNVAGHLSTV
jgi:hypothetical protein